MTGLPLSGSSKELAEKLKNIINALGSMSPLENLPQTIKLDCLRLRLCRLSYVLLQTGFPLNVQAALHDVRHIEGLLPASLSEQSRNDNRPSILRRPTRWKAKIPDQEIAHWLKDQLNKCCLGYHVAALSGRSSATQSETRGLNDKLEAISSTTSRLEVQAIQRRLGELRSDDASKFTSHPDKCERDLNLLKDSARQVDEPFSRLLLDPTGHLYNCTQFSDQSHGTMGNVTSPDFPHWASHPSRHTYQNTVSNGEAKVIMGDVRGYDPYRPHIVQVTDSKKGQEDVRTEEDAHIEGTW